MQIGRMGGYKSSRRYISVQTTAVDAAERVQLVVKGGQEGRKGRKGGREGREGKRDGGRKKRREGEEGREGGNKVLRGYRMTTPPVPCLLVRNMVDAKLFGRTI